MVTPTPTQLTQVEQEIKEAIENQDTVTPALYQIMVGTAAQLNVFLNNKNEVNKMHDLVFCIYNRPVPEDKLLYRNWCTRFTILDYSKISRYFEFSHISNGNTARFFISKNLETAYIFLLSDNHRNEDLLYNGAYLSQDAILARPIVQLALPTFQSEMINFLFDGKVTTDLSIKDQLH